LTLATALVLPGAALVRLELSAEYEATCTVDGQVDVPLEDKDVVTVTASESDCHFVRLRRRDEFYRTLLERLR
jgi:NAD kinase